MSAQFAPNPLGRRTFEDFRRLTKGHISTLWVTVNEENSDDGRNKVISLNLMVDGAEIGRSSSICFWSLIDSAHIDGEHEIFICPDCGNAACTGIYRGVVTVHQGGFTLWKAFGTYRRRILIFQSATYQKEIFDAVRHALDRYRMSPIDVRFSPSHTVEFLEKCLFEAEGPILTP